MLSVLSQLPCKEQPTLETAVYDQRYQCTTEAFKGGFDLTQALTVHCKSTPSVLVTQKKGLQFIFHTDI